MVACGLLAAVIAFSALCAPCGAQEASGGNPLGLGFSATADSRCSLWFTSDDDNDDPLQGNVIDYDTNPMITWAVTAALTWRQGRVIGVSVQRPFEPPGDRDVLFKVESPTMSIEDCTAFLQMPFLQSLRDRKQLRQGLGASPRILEAPVSRRRHGARTVDIRRPGLRRAAPEPGRHD